MSENIIQYVAAACNGDTDAMAKLYSKTLKASYFLADTLTAGDGTAQEITKKAYAKAFCTIDKLKRPEAFEIWMKQNVALVYKETQKFVFGDAEAGAAENSSDFLPESVLSDRDSCVKILEAVAALKPVLRTALVLHYNNGMPVAALAKFLGVSESTANALLGKARAEILSFCGIESSAMQAKSLPVLTRIFQFKAVDTAIDNTAVRDIFIYAIDAYEAAKPAVSPVAPIEETPAAPEAPEVEEAPAAVEEEAAPEADIKEAEPVSEASNIISFKQKINEILDSEKVPAESDSSAESTVAESDTEDIDIPAFAVHDEIPSVSDETLDNFAPEVKPEKPEKRAKSGFKLPEIKVNPKLLGIAGAVLVVLIVVIAIVAGNGGEPDVGTSSGDSSNVASTTQAQAVSANGYKWVEGGFAECEEIVYLDENCAYFKSKTTGKYGLMDYQGNVILQPYYDGFDRCSSGRDYSSRNSYHSLVKVGNESYEFTILDGVVTVSQTPHSAHSIDTDSMGDVSYDERDRYFEGYAAARKDDKWGYVSQEDDKRVIKYEYEAVNELQLGAAAACDYCRPVTGGLIAVKKDGKMGIINLKNKEVVPFDYDNIMPGSNGVFIACKDGVWGVILVGDAVASFKGVNITVVEQQSTNVAENPEETTLGKYKVTSDDGANIRTDAGADYDLVGELSYGDTVIGYATKTAENGNDWLCIKHDGEFAWVAMSNLEAVEE